jgi:uncharacterized repeat protein (TIGR01451 family)
MTRTLSVPRGALPRAIAIIAVALALLVALVADAAHAQDVEITPHPGESGTIVEREGDGFVPSYRYRGTNRFDTARLIALDDVTLQADEQNVFVDADTVLLARADLFPDALAGNYLAGQTRSPILLVSTGGAIEPSTQAALDAIAPDNLILLGGVGAISAEVEADLTGQGFEVDRIAGQTRFETAAMIARQAPGPQMAIVASGVNFPDALVAGALSYGEQLPLLLTQPGELNSTTRTALEELGITDVMIPGGTAAVSAAAQAEIEALGIAVERRSGATRVGTAVSVADFAIERFGWDRAHVNLARGDTFPDSLTMGPHAGEERAALLLTNSPTALDDGQRNVAAFLQAETCWPSVLHLAGGPAAISHEVEQQARELATAPAGHPCLIQDLQPDTAVNEVGDPHTVTATVVDNAGRPATGGQVEFAVWYDGDDDGGVFEPEDGVVDIAADGTASFTFTAETAGRYEIEACIVPGEGDAAGHCASVEKVYEEAPVEDAALALTKETDAESVTVGDEITYTLTATNTGGVALTGVTVTDTLPTELAAVVTQDETCDWVGDAEAGTETVTCALGDLDVGESAAASFTVTAVAPGAEDEEVVNTAEAFADQVLAVPATASAAAVIVPVPGPDSADLAVSITTDATEVTVGDTFDFAMTVTNLGPDAAEDVRIQFGVNWQLQIAGATITPGTLDDCELAMDQRFYVCDVGTLAPGAEIDLTMTAEALVPFTPFEHPGTAVIMAFSQVTADPDYGNNVQFSSEVTVVPAEPEAADLSVTIDTDDTEVFIEDTVTYDVLVANAGPATATGVTLVVQLPAELTFAAVSTTVGDGGDLCDVDQGTVTCVFDELAPEGLIGVAVTAFADALTDVDPAVATATVSADQDDPNPADNEDAAPGVVIVFD